MVRSHHFERFVDWKNRNAFFDAMTEMMNRVLSSGNFDLVVHKQQMLASTHCSQYSRRAGIGVAYYTFGQLIHYHLNDQYRHDHVQRHNRDSGSRCPVCFFDELQRVGFLLVSEMDDPGAYYTRAFIEQWFADTKIKIQQLIDDVIWDSEYARAPGHRTNTKYLQFSLRR